MTELEALTVPSCCGSLPTPRGVAYTACTASACCTREHVIDLTAAAARVSVLISVLHGDVRRARRRESPEQPRADNWPQIGSSSVPTSRITLTISHTSVVRTVTLHACSRASAGASGVLGWAVGALQQRVRLVVRNRSLSETRNRSRSSAQRGVCKSSLDAAVWRVSTVYRWRCSTRYR